MRCYVQSGCRNFADEYLLRIKLHTSCDAAPLVAPTPCPHACLRCSWHLLRCGTPRSAPSTFLISDTSSLWGDRRFAITSSLSPASCLPSNALSFSFPIPFAQSMSFQTDHFDHHSTLTSARVVSMPRVHVQSPTWMCSYRTAPALSSSSSPLRYVRNF